MKLAAAILFVSLTAQAATPKCLVHFASVPADAVDYSLIETTYDKLFDTLGARVDTETLEGMVGKDNGTPFKVPEEKAADWQALNKNLEGLEKLIEDKGWNRPDVRARLYDRLRRRVEARRQTDGDRERKRSQTRGDYQVKVGEQRAYTASPDGKWIVFVDGHKNDGLAAPLRLTVINVESGEKRVYPTVDGAHVVGFTADGNHLYLERLGDRLDWIPFTNGVPDFTHTKTAHVPGWPGGYFNRVEAAKPDLVYVEGLPGNLACIDLTTGKATRIDFTGVLQGEERLFSMGWSVVKGTSHIAVRTQTGPDANRYLVLRVAPDGKASLIKKTELRTPIDSSFIPLTWRADGNVEYFIRDESAVVHNGPNGPETLVTVDEFGKGTFDATINAVASDGRTMLFHFHPASDGSRKDIVWDTVNRRTRFTYPEKSWNPMLSPDGKRAFLFEQPNDQKGNLRVFNVEAPREVTP